MNQQQVLDAANAIAVEIRDHRRWLHAHPEVGFDMPQTISYVRSALENMGYSVTGWGKAALTASIGPGNGRTILLRADMDALPVKEEADVPFRSENGSMHACGHDLHTAMLLGAARLLKKWEAQLSGKVIFLFQAAEEILEGAKDVLDAGLLEKEHVDAAMMIHVITGLPLPTGTVVVSSPGVSSPAADYFQIRVQGKGCHGSTPQQGIDSLTAASHILIALQEIKARELALNEEAVITIGSFHGGKAGNVIADMAQMEGTMRCYDESVRAYLKERITGISLGVATAFRTSADVAFGAGCPTLTNDAVISGKVAGYTKALLGEKRAFTSGELNGDGIPSRSGGSEDFAYITQRVPSVMLAISAGEEDHGVCYPQHHPKVRFSEEVLPTGSAVFAYTALRFLEGD